MDKTTQYRLIDYLRLFRLCKNIGIVKRKRKLPNEYKDSNQRSAGKRLIHAMVKHSFPDYDTKSDNNNYYVTIPKDINTMLSALGSKPRSYFDNAGTEGAEALRRFSVLRQNLGGFIYPSLPYEIKICIISGDNDNRYNRLVRSGIRTSRPREAFYGCAQKCIEYKQIWDRNIPYLMSFFASEEGRQKEREAEAMRLKQERRKAERLRLEQERNNNQTTTDDKKNEELRKLEEKIEKEKQARITNAQTAFNRAMEQFMRTNNG